MNELNALLNRQYRRYRARMDFLAYRLRWKVRMPFERMF